MKPFGICFNDLKRQVAHALICGLVCIAFAAGCSDRIHGPVNINVAQKTLASAMECWKDGRTPKDLLEGSPSVFVQDAEWNDITQLLGYEIINDKQSAGPNLIATVKLKLKDMKGKISEKTATYVVGTSPSLVVYRNVMK